MRVDVRVFWLHLPNLTIERLLPPSKLMGAEAVQQVVDILRRNHAIVALLNCGS